MRGRPEAERAFHDFLKSPGEVSVTPHILFELYRGVSRGPNPKREVLEIERLGRTFRLLPFEREAARLAGKMAEFLRDEGIEVADLDLLIAASAIVWGDGEIVTRDVAHFGRLGRFGLKVRSG